MLHGEVHDVRLEHRLHRLGEDHQRELVGDQRLVAQRSPSPPARQVTNLLVGRVHARRARPSTVTNAAVERHDPGRRQRRARLQRVPHRDQPQAERRSRSNGSHLRHRHEPRGGRRVTRTRRPPRSGPTCRTDPAAGRAFSVLRCAGVRKITRPRTGGISTSTYDRSRARTRRDCRRRPRRGRDHERHARRADHHPRAHVDRRDPRAPRRPGAGELERLEQRRHRPRGPLRAQLHARAARRLDRHHQGRRRSTSSSSCRASCGTTSATHDRLPGRRRLPVDHPAHDVRARRGRTPTTCVAGSRRCASTRCSPTSSSAPTPRRSRSGRRCSSPTATPTSPSPRRAPPPAPTSTSAA